MVVGGSILVPQLKLRILQCFM